jgi:hypothetical protein
MIVSFSNARSKNDDNERRLASQGAGREEQSVDNRPPFTFFTRREKPTKSLPAAQPQDDVA